MFRREETEKLGNKQEEAEKLGNKQEIVKASVGFAPKFTSHIATLRSSGATERTHICIPCCIDPTPEFTQETFQSFFEKLEELKVSYTIFLVVNDERAYEIFLNVHSATIKKMGASDEDLHLDGPLEKPIMTEKDFKSKKIIRIEKWRKIDLYRNQTETAYTNYFVGNSEYEKIFKHDVAIYRQKHTDIEEDVIKGHYHQEGKDFLSWSNRESSSVTYIVLYISHGVPEFLKRIRIEASSADKSFSQIPPGKEQDQPVFFYFINGSNKKEKKKNASLKDSGIIPDKEGLTSIMAASMGETYAKEVFAFLRQNQNKEGAAVDEEEMKKMATKAGIMMGGGLLAFRKMLLDNEKANITESGLFTFFNQSLSTGATKQGQDQLLPPSFLPKPRLSKAQQED